MPSLARRSLVGVGSCLLLAACASAPAPGVESAPRAPSCEVGVDQTCNDDPAISSLHGACQPDRTCACKPGFARHPATGRCR